MTEDEHDDDLWHENESKQFRLLLESHSLYKDYSYGRLVRAVADEAKKAPGDNQYWCLARGLEVVETIMRAVNEDGWKLLDDEDGKFQQPVFWYHKDRLRLAGKKRLDPWIKVAETQEAAAAYLHLPYRVPALDRILVDMLIAAEMLAFADEMQPILKRKIPIILSWLLNNIAGLIVTALIVAAVIWIGGENTVTLWISGIIAAVGLLGTAWSLIAFPFFYPQLRAHQKKTEDIIARMLDAYYALGGHPASAKHIDEQISKGTDKGAIWPSQLIVLMEDIRSRSATI